MNPSFSGVDEWTFDMSTENLRSVLRISSTQGPQVREGLESDDVVIGRYVLVEVGSLTCEGWTVSGDAILDKGAIDDFETFSVAFVGTRNREIHSHCSIDLNVDKPRRKDFAAEIHNSIWHA